MKLSVASLTSLHSTLLACTCRAHNLRSTKRIAKENTLPGSEVIADLFSINGSVSFDLTEKNESFSYFNESSDDNYDELLHPSFELIESEFLKDFNSECNTFKHKKTGAEIFFVNWESGSVNSTGSSSSLGFDDESTFGIFFRTPPSDSTGVAHILEHALLAGSRKYKTKEPFVDLMKSSMSTFLNAMTWPDKTGYVFASRNLKDFYNLMNVYLDAVFFPRAVKDPFILAQEGWRLEPNDFDTLNNITNIRDVELIYNGIAYSEMKGAYSDPSQFLMRYTDMNLFPDNTYFFDYGGDPKQIPTLSFDDLVEFYFKFYHPSNAKIFVSGVATNNDAIHDTLSIMDEYLSEFDKNITIKDQSAVKYQKRTIDKPILKSYPFQAAPASEEDDDIYNSLDAQHIIQVSWLINDEPLTLLHELALTVLDELLMSESSMFSKKLFESGFGGSILGGMSSDMIQQYYSAGLSGVYEEDVFAVEKLVIDSMKEVALIGFTDDEISATMNSLEFLLRELGQGSGSKGILLMFACISKWNYDQKPTEGLKFEQPLSELKEIIKQSGTQIFKDLINDHILNNTHRVTIHLYPSDTFDSDQLKDVTDEIEQIKESLSDQELQDILDLAVELKEKQSQPDTKEDFATIPTLTIDDINHNLTDEYPITVQENVYGTGVTLVSHDIGSTSGVLYVDFGVDVSNVPFEDIKYLQLFDTLLGSVGINSDSSKGNYTTVEELTQSIGLHTGGIYSQLFVSPVKNEREGDNLVLNDENFITKLMIMGKATEDKTGHLLQLFNDILLHSNFEDAQGDAIAILQSDCSYWKQMDIPASGDIYASMRIRAKYTVAGMFEETMYGVRSVEILCDNLLPRVEKDWPHVLSKLLSIRDIIFDQSFTRSGMVINLTGDKQVLSYVESDVKTFLDELPGIANSNMALPNFYNTTHPWVIEANKEMLKLGESKNEAIIASTLLNYVGKGQVIYKKGEVISGATDVITNYLDLDYLWHKIRILGGAYGASNYLHLNEGVHTFESWHDPNFVETLDVYKNVADALLTIANDLREHPKKLELSIISSISMLDGSVLSSEMMGWVSFVRWLVQSTSISRKKWRDDILNTTPDDFERFAAKLVNTSSTVTTATVCSEAAYEKANKTIHLEIVDVY